MPSDDVIEGELVTPGEEADQGLHVKTVQGSMKGMCTDPMATKCT